MARPAGTCAPAPTLLPGTLALVLRAGFADGETVEVDDTLIVVPPEPSDPFPWAAAIVGGGLAVGFVVVALLPSCAGRSA